MQDSLSNISDSPRAVHHVNRQWTLHSANSSNCSASFSRVQQHEQAANELSPWGEMQFQPIEALGELDLRSTVDVVGILDTVADAYVVTTKFGKETRKRSLVLKDDSMCSIEMTLWGEPADAIGAQLQQVSPCPLERSEGVCAAQADGSRSPEKDGSSHGCLPN